MEFDAEEIDEGAGDRVGEAGGTESDFGLAGVARLEDFVKGAVRREGEDGQVVALAVVDLGELADFDLVVKGGGDALGGVGVENEANGEFSILLEGTQEEAYVRLFDAEDDFKVVAVGDFGKGVPDIEELAFAIGEVFGGDDAGFWGADEGAVAEVFHAAVGLSLALGTDLGEFALGFVAHALGSGGFDLPALLLLGDDGELGLVVGIFETGENLARLHGFTFVHEDFLDFARCVSDGLGEQGRADFAFRSDAEGVGNDESGQEQEENNDSPEEEGSSASGKDGLAGAADLGEKGADGKVVMVVGRFEAVSGSFGEAGGGIFGLGGEGRIFVPEGDEQKVAVRFVRCVGGNRRDMTCHEMADSGGVKEQRDILRIFG